MTSEIAGGNAFGSRYTIENLIGRGSMGRVYRGLVRDTGEDVAVKVLRDDLASQPEIVARFIQERQVLRAVNHPNVVGVRDLVVEGEQLGIIMDLVTGGDLRTAVATPMPADRALALTAQIADGLAAVHAANVVHRDLKPENVLADRWPDGSLRPRLTDFGVSRLISQSMTKVTSLIGTPGYLSPEAAHGHSVEAPADIYALGVMLYEMVCDRPPFRADNVIALIRAHAEDTVPRPSGMPDSLWSLLHAMLAKEPAQRPTATQVAASARQLTLTNTGPYTVAAPADNGFDSSATIIRTAPAPAFTVPTATVLREASASAGPMLSHGNPAPPGSPPVSGGPARNRRRRNALIGAGVVLALGAAALAAVVLTSSGGKSDKVSTAAAAADTTTPKASSKQQSSSAKSSTSAPVRNAAAANTATSTTVAPSATQPARTDTTRLATSVAERTTTTARPTTTMPTTATIAPTPPAKPTVWTSSVGQTTFRVNWSVASFGVPNTLSWYILKINGGEVYRGPETTFRQSVGLSAGTTYSFSVWVYNSAGLYSVAAGEVTTSTPPTTTTTTTTTPYRPSVYISWGSPVTTGSCTSNCQWAIIQPSGFSPGLHSIECWGSWQGWGPWTPSVGATSFSDNNQVQSCIFGYYGYQVKVLVDGTYWSNTITKGWS